MSSAVSETASGGHRRRNGSAPFIAPSFVLLFLSMIVPLVITLYFSIEHYNLLSANGPKFTGLNNYLYLVRDPAFVDALINSCLILASVLGLTVVGGTLLAWLYDQTFPGSKVARLLSSRRFLLCRPSTHCFGRTCCFILSTAFWLSLCGC